MAEAVPRQHKDLSGRATFSFMAPGHRLRALGIRLPRIVRALDSQILSPGMRERRVDNLFILENNEIAHLELQTEPATARDLERFLDCAYLIRQEHSVAVHTVVIYGGRRVRSAPALWRGGSLRYRVKNVYLNRMDGQAVLGSLEARVRAGRTLSGSDELRLACCGLMDHGGTDLAPVVRRAAALLPAVSNSTARDACEAAVFSFATEVAISPREIRRILGVMQVAATKLCDVVEARGRAKGKAEALLTVVGKLHGVVPAGLAERVRRERRIEVLDRWLDLALQGETIDGFAAGMDVPGDGR